MRVVLKSSLGLMLLAGFGTSQQIKENTKTVRPVEKQTIYPVTFSWDELRQIQASLPKGVSMGSPMVEQFEQAAAGSSEATKDIVLPDPNVLRSKGQMLPTAPAGGIEKLGGCTGFPVIPPASLSTIGQPDGPDSFATLRYPPNAAGGVGPSHLMVMAPNFTLIQDRLGATISSVDTITFWAPTGAASVTYCRLDYDDVNGRWHAIARGGSGVGGTSILFAISDTDDPTGSWDFYTLPADPGFTTFADNLKKGYNQNWVVVTAEMYLSTVAGGNQGSRLYTFDVAGALAGGPVTANTFSNGYVTALTGQGNATVNWRNIPTRSLDGSLAEIHLLNSRLATSTSPIFQMIRITGTGTAPVLAPYGVSLFGPNPATASLFFIPTDYTNSRQSVFQVGDIRSIDPIPPDGTFASTRARLADAVVRNGKIFFVQNHGLPAPVAAAATRNGLGFYELDPAGVIDGGTGVGPFNQQVQVNDGINTTCFYPSIAVNCAEDVLVGFSRSDLTKNIEAAYMMRLGTDAPNTMGPTTTLKLGESSWWQLGPPPATTLGAWGYYSSSAVDPNDDGTLWTLQPYAATRVGGTDPDSRWGTWWGRLGDCDVLPEITDDPDDIAACVGDTVPFTVVATTTSIPLTYQWRKNGVDILGETSATYTIASAAPADAGSYDCVVKSCGCRISLPATLSFAGAVIGTQPLSQNIAIGAPATFFLAATGSGTLTYQWLFNGNPLLGEIADTLLIPSVAGTDYGSYSCIVSDDCGPLTSDTVILHPEIKTKHQPAELSLAIFLGPQATIGCNGGSASFSVVAEPAGVSYLWRKNGTPIVPPQTGSTLVLTGITAGDAGNYSVKVSLGAESKTSSAASLIFSDVPTINVQPSPGNQTVAPGANVTYTVVASGLNVTYQWKHKPTTPFAPYVNIEGANDPTLTLESVNTADAGTYRCAVSNDCGTVQTIQLKLLVL